MSCDEVGGQLMDRSLYGNFRIEILARPGQPARASFLPCVNRTRVLQTSAPPYPPATDHQGPGSTSAERGWCTGPSRDRPMCWQDGNTWSGTCGGGPSRPACTSLTSQIRCLVEKLDPTGTAQADPDAGCGSVAAARGRPWGVPASLATEVAERADSRSDQPQRLVLARAPVADPRS